MSSPPTPPAPIVTVYEVADTDNAVSKEPPPPVLSPVTDERYPPAPPPPPFLFPPAPPPATTTYSTLLPRFPIFYTTNVPAEVNTWAR